MWIDIIDYNEFINGSNTATTFKKVTDQIIKEGSEKLIDDISVKRGENWSILASQVFGCENF